MSPPRLALHWMQAGRTSKKAVARQLPVPGDICLLRTPYLLIPLRVGISPSKSAGHKGLTKKGDTRMEFISVIDWLVSV